MFPRFNESDIFLPTPISMIYITFNQNKFKIHDGHHFKDGSQVYLY